MELSFVELHFAVCFSNLEDIPFIEIEANHGLFNTIWEKTDAFKNMEWNLAYMGHKRYRFIYFK